MSIKISKISVELNEKKQEPWKNVVWRGGFKKHFAEEGWLIIIRGLEVFWKGMGTWQEMGREEVGGIVTLKETVQ